VSDIGDLALQYPAWSAAATGDSTVPARPSDEVDGVVGDLEEEGGIECGGHGEVLGGEERATGFARRLYSVPYSGEKVAKLMGFYNRDGTLIEASALSDGLSGSRGWVVEFWDLTPGGRDEIMHVHKSSQGEYSVDLLGGEANEAFIAWAISVAKSELGDH
jgi:hypothetical protein